MSLENTEKILETANQRLVETNLLMEGIEDRQRKLIEHAHRLLHYIAQLTKESNAWRFRAEEMEKERNQWQTRAEVAELSLGYARRLNARLAVQTGEARCPNCGSSAITLLHGMFPTGVTSP